MKTLHPEDARLVAMFNEGKGGRLIGKELGWSRGKVDHAFIRLGLKRETRIAHASSIAGTDRKPRQAIAKSAISGETSQSGVETQVCAPGTYPYWGWLSDNRWTRIGQFERTIYDDGERRFIDPGAAYPPGWDGPKIGERIADQPRLKDRAVGGMILTGAQDRTPVHGPAVVNLQAYAAWLGYGFRTGTVTYARDWYSSLFEERERKTVRRGDNAVRTWSSAIPGATIEREDILENLVFFADHNIRPTAHKPLTQVTKHGKSRPALFPHPKQSLVSVPRFPHGADPLFVASTGFITPPNYVDRLAGKVAEFHHIIGAVIVEWDADGEFFIRHIHCDSTDGSFFDLDRRVDRGRITTGHRPNVVYADAHFRAISKEVADATWFGGKCDTSLRKGLNVAREVYHDTLDFYARSHHNLNDPWHHFETRDLTVQGEINEVASWLQRLDRDHDAVMYIAESNHDLALGRWLREDNWRRDPHNAELFLSANLYALTRIREGQYPNVYEHAVRRAAPDLKHVHFLRREMSLQFAGVEVGPHGNHGPNGSKGSPTGHVATAGLHASADGHSPVKEENFIRAGVMTDLAKMPKYAKGGATSWANVHVLVYPNGRFTHTWIRKGRWRALRTPR